MKPKIFDELFASCSGSDECTSSWMAEVVSMVNSVFFMFARRGRSLEQRICETTAAEVVAAATDEA